MDERQPAEARSDRGSMLIAASIVGAALILSWGLSADEPRYQLAASGDTIVRMDTDSGELIACDRQGCSRIRAPARARTFGPLTVELDDSNEARALPPANPPKRQ
ncbi:MAG TPA: hypothetical protein VJM15_00285 [Sphingomicrobium sp.]|nr:hypothetical protein [Sphingomicrobium sp.]